MWIHYKGLTLIILYFSILFDLVDKLVKLTFYQPRDRGSNPCSTTQLV